MRECAHVDTAARMVKEQEDRYRAAVSATFARNGPQSISQGEIQGFTRLGSFPTGHAPRARLSTLSAERLLGSRQPAVGGHVAWMQTRFTQFCRGYAHE